MGTTKKEFPPLKQFNMSQYRLNPDFPGHPCAR